MKLEVQTKAQEIQAQIQQLHLDAREFRTQLNVAAMRSKSPLKFGAHELAQHFKTLVDEWEKNHLQKLNQIYDSL